MRVLMFGWEFPPYISGGLGTACFGMTEGLSKCGVDVTFILPSLMGGLKKKENTPPHAVNLKGASGTEVTEHEEYMFDTYTKDIRLGNVLFHHVDSILTPYATEETYSDYLQQWRNEYGYSEHFHHSGDVQRAIHVRSGYGENLIEEVHRYAKAAAVISMRDEYDVIHAHDWITYLAGVLAKRITGKPLVVHLHATEFDRSGENVNQQVYDIERFGLNSADMVMAVSHRTRQIAIDKYGVDPNKVHVVYNAVAKKEAIKTYAVPRLMQHEKRVLFMSRITYQKGPEYFVEAAKLVLDKIPDVRFIMAGSGDMLNRMVRRASQLRIGSRFHFPGFMRGEDVDRMYAISDLYVMPSVSEPFGIAPLEAMVYDTPVLMSKQSGVAEVLVNALKVDFWDVREMANKICAVLAYPTMGKVLCENSQEELRQISWYKVAQRINSLYKEVTGV